MAAESADSKDSVAGPPDLVGAATDLVVQANYSAADSTRRAAVGLETVVWAAGGGGGNDGWGLHTVRGEQGGEGLYVLG